MGSPNIGDHRFEGYSLADKHAWMNQGPGPSVLENARSALAGLGGDLATAEETLRNAVSKLGAAWEGNAAESAGAKMVQAADWAGGSGATTSQAATAVEQQATAVGTVKASVPPPPDMSYGVGDAMVDAGKTMFNTFTGGIFGVQTNAAEKVEAYRKADAQANSAMYAYQSASQANVDALPTLDDPPPIAVETASSTPPPAPKPVPGPSSPAPRFSGGGSTSAQGYRPPSGGAGAPAPVGGTTLQPGAGGSTSTQGTFDQPPPIGNGNGDGSQNGQNGQKGTDANTAALIAGGLGMGAGAFAGGSTLSDGAANGRGIRSGALGQLLNEDDQRAGQLGGGVRGAADEAAAGRTGGTRTTSGLGPLNAEEEAAQRSGAAGRPGAAGGTGAPGAGGAHGQGEDDLEHTDRYAVASDEYFYDGMPRVAPPVIGE